MALLPKMPNLLRRKSTSSSKSSNPSPAPSSAKPRRSSSACDSSAPSPARPSASRTMSAPQRESGEVDFESRKMRYRNSLMKRQKQSYGAINNEELAARERLWKMEAEADRRRLSRRQNPRRSDVYSPSGRPKSTLTREKASNSGSMSSTSKTNNALRPVQEGYNQQAALPLPGEAQWYEEGWDAWETDDTLSGEELGHIASRWCQCRACRPPRSHHKDLSTTEAAQSRTVSSRDFELDRADTAAAAVKKMERNELEAGNNMPGSQALENNRHGSSRGSGLRSEYEALTKEIQELASFAKMALENGPRSAVAQPDKLNDKHYIERKEKHRPPELMHIKAACQRRERPPVGIDI